LIGERVFTFQRGMIILPGNERSTDKERMQVRIKGLFVLDAYFSPLQPDDKPGLASFGRGIGAGRGKAGVERRAFNLAVFLFCSLLRRAGR